MTPEEVGEICFGKPGFGKRGYNEDEVDAFLDLIAGALSGKNALTPDDIHDVEFSRPARGMRAYNQAQVDSFLDDAEEALIDYLRAHPRPAEPGVEPPLSRWRRQ